MSLSVDMIFRIMPKKPLKTRVLRKFGPRVAVSANQFRDARIFSGMSREAAADFLQVSVRTIGHWETGRARPSYAAFKLLRVMRHGDLIHPAWSACKINRRGALVTPEGHEIWSSDLAWLSLLVRRAKAFGELFRQREQDRSRREPPSPPAIGFTYRVSYQASPFSSVRPVVSAESGPRSNTGQKGAPIVQGGVP